MTSTSPPATGLELVGSPAPPPPDPALPHIHGLFNPDWLWMAFCHQFGEPEGKVERLRIRQFHYEPGRRAMVAYIAERAWEDLLVEDEFGVEMRPDRDILFFRYPNDPYLPGLPTVADPLAAHVALEKHVPLHPQRIRVQQVVYRPSSRAVLRYNAAFRRTGSSVTLYVRVLRPAELPDWLTAADAVAASGFLVPRVAGIWPEQGVAWLNEVPGPTLRDLVVRGGAPEPGLVLDALAPLWSVPFHPEEGNAMSVQRGFNWTYGILNTVLPAGPGRESLQRAVSAFQPWVADWQPTAIAHNDFYDAQVIVTPEQRLAVVDFEETGPGDPMIDIGNMLAHLRWRGAFGDDSDRAQRSLAYHKLLRSEALSRFRWNTDRLALREAYCLFRLAGNPVRKARAEWVGEVEKVLDLVNGILDGRS
jgi:Phosphotransferase enzyme family